MSAQRVSYAGYDQALLIENRDTRVVLCPQCGGRVLSYAYQGIEALLLRREQDGYLWDGDTTPGSWPNVSGGRCDLGPEMVIPPRPELWVGAWQAEITGERSVRLTSPLAPGPGVRLTRDFALAESGSQLSFTQTQTNVSQGETRWCHWSRTYGQGHGICLVPLTPAQSHLPNGYLQYSRSGDGPGLLLRPQDPAIAVDDDYLVVYDTPQQPKLGIASHAGWFAYLMPNDLMFVKRYPTYPARAYNEIAGFTLALYYRQDNMYCEMEPIGPMEVLQPGESASFSEVWWLAPFAFPEDRRALDLAAVAQAAQSVMG